MSILPTRSSLNQSASTVLAELKKGDRQKLNEFVWTHQERFYAIALLATGNHQTAEALTINAFQNVFMALRQLNPKRVGLPLWDWLVPYIVDSCADYHRHYSSVPVQGTPLDPNLDGSNQMDWETTVILGSQRVRRCLSTLPIDQQKVFILRQQLACDYTQIATILNQGLETTMSSLFRARVQIVKCLGRG